MLLLHLANNHFRPSFDILLNKDRIWETICLLNDEKNSEIYTCNMQILRTADQQLLRLAKLQLNWEWGQWLLMERMKTVDPVITNKQEKRNIQRQDNRQSFSLCRRLIQAGRQAAGRQTGSAKSVYLPAGRQGGVVKGGGGGGGGQEEVEPEQEHS